MLRRVGAGEVAHQQRDTMVAGGDARRQAAASSGAIPSRLWPVSMVERSAAAPAAGREETVHSATRSMN